MPKTFQTNSFVIFFFAFVRFFNKNIEIMKPFYTFLSKINIIIIC